jgi:hypothetical protein
VEHPERSYQARIMKNWRSIPMNVSSLMARRDIQPFAGLYPTRWRIKAKYSFSKYTPDQTFEYVGCPNGTVAWFVRRLLSFAFSGEIRAYEFDRGGVHAWARSRLQRESTDLAASDYSRVYRFYYPWIAARGYIVTPWTSGPMHRLPLLHQGRKFTLYSASTLEQVPVASWQEFKQWLSSANLVLGKPPLTSTS